MYLGCRFAFMCLATVTVALVTPAVADQAPGTNEAQNTVPQPEKKEKKEKLQEVLVTGSLIKENISDISVPTALPLTIVTADDIAQQGPQGLTETLRLDPTFTGGSSNGGSGGYFAGGVTTIDMFGLGDQYTLVLVDGQRFNAVTPTNIANIPASAISRIEILKDGGSSIYGSDAVAGVVNIILNHNFKGMEVTAGYGDRVFGADRGTHARDFTTDVKFGVSDERMRVVGNIEFRKRGGTIQTDSELGRTGSIDERVIYSSPPNIILPSGEDVILNYNVFKPGQYSLNPADYIPYNFTNYNQTIGQIQRQTLTDRQPQQAVSGFLSLEYDLSSKWSFFTEIYDSHFTAFEQDKDWGVDGYGDPHLDFGPIPATNYWNPFKIDTRDVYAGLPEIGGVTYNATIDTQRILGGFRGRAGQFDWEVSGNYFRNDQRDVSGNYYSDSALYDAIHRTGPTAINLFCYACNTPEQLAGISIGQELETISQQSIFDAKLTGPILVRDNYSFRFAAGGETRYEQWSFTPDPLTATGDSYYQQFSPSSQARRDSAVYAEVAYHLGEGAEIPGLHDVTINVSARHDWIESVGGSTNPHIVASWQPVSSDFMLRGSYGSSFRAPPINLLTATQTVTNDYLNYPGGVQLPTDVIEGGNPNLKPETAHTLSLGLVLAPRQLPGTVFTVDRIQIHQRNVVLIPNPQDIIDGTFPGTVDYSGVRPLINATATNAAGRNITAWDAALDLRYATAKAGAFGLKYRGVFLTQFDVNNGPGYVSQLGQFQAYVFNVGQPGALGSLPKSRQRGGPFYTIPNGSVTFQFMANYISHYQDDPGANRMVGQFLTYDLTADADLSRVIPGLSLNAGILNLNNTQPPYVKGFYTTYLLYDPGLSNSLGRYGFLTLKYRF